MAAILDIGRHWRTQFWKGTTQGTFQQSLVEIGSVVSEEKIFLISSPLFLICIIGQNRQKFKVHKNPVIYVKKLIIICLYSSNLGTFWLTIEQFLQFEEISIFSNGGHFGYRTALTDKIWKGTTQVSFQQSLVEIGSVVSEEKIFF